MIGSDAVSRQVVLIHAEATDKQVRRLLASRTVHVRVRIG